MMMLFTFILIGNQSLQLSIRLLLERLGITKAEHNGRYIAYGSEGMENGWIAVQPLCGAEEDFDSNELDWIREIVEDPLFVLVEGRDGEVCYSNRFVLGLDHPETFVIDNDHGLIARADRIQNMIRGGESWLGTILRE
jgi:hypothetical protein